MAAVHVVRRRATARATSSGFIPWVGWPEYLYAVAVVGRARSGAHAAPDTRADTQIPQSLTRLGYVRRVRLPRTEGSPVRLFPRTARHRLLAALSAAALAMGAVSVPLAHADDLKDRRERRSRTASSTPTTTLDDSSARMRRAMARARRRPAGARLGPRRAGRGTQVALDAARERDREMQAEAGAGPGPARAGPGRARRRAGPTSPCRSDAVTEMVTSMYQAEDPQLQALTSMMQRRGPRGPHLGRGGPRRRRAARRRVRTTSCAPPRCCSRSARQQVAEAEQAVEVQREEAAAHLLVTQDLTAAGPRRPGPRRARPSAARRDARNAAAVRAAARPPRAAAAQGAGAARSSS